MHTLINASKKKNKNIRSKKQKRKEYLIRSDFFFFSLFLVWVCCCCSSFLLLLLVPKGPGNNINRSLGSATAPDFYLLFPFSDCSFFTQGLETAHRKTHTRHFPKVSLFFFCFFFARLACCLGYTQLFGGDFYLRVRNAPLDF